MFKLHRYNRIVKYFVEVFITLFCISSIQGKFIV